MGVSAERVRADVARMLDVPVGSIGEDEDLTEYGMDSVRLMSLVNDWASTGTPIAYTDLIHTPTLTAWTTLIVRT